MKSLIKKYKLVIKFILTFLFVYGVLAVCYAVYLHYSDGFKYYPDYLTNLVANQCKALLNTLGYNAKVIPHPNEASIKLFINQKYLARVIEGCNAVSVIILFLSFVVAFSGNFKSTVLYILFGSVLIYVVNVLRIVFLTIGLYHFPQYEHLLHNIVFPVIIYGIVFLLWIFWVKTFSIVTKTNA